MGRLQHGKGFYGAMGKNGSIRPGKGMARRGQGMDGSPGPGDDGSVASVGGLG